MGIDIVEDRRLAKAHALTRREAGDFWLDSIKGPAGNKFWWFIWCHVRCELAGNTEYRKSLSQKLECANAQLVCLDGTDRLNATLSSLDDTIPFILMTDWSGAKAKLCFREIEQVMGRNQSILLVVFCKFNDEARKAAAWAQTVTTRNFKVHAGRTLEVVDDIIRTLTRKTTAKPDVTLRSPCFRQARCPAPTAGPQCQTCASGHPCAHHGGTATDFPFHPAGGLPVWSAFQFTRTTAACRPPSSYTATASCAPARHHDRCTPATQVMQFPESTEPVISFEAISDLQASCGADGLQKLLQESLPDYYDD